MIRASDLTPFDAAAILIVLAAMNVFLFLLSGLEVVMVPANARLIPLGAGAILLVIGARILWVLGPLTALRPQPSPGRLAPVTLIWGGSRGGISIALAPGLAEAPARAVSLACTIMIVLLSVIAQGGSVERMFHFAPRRFDPSPP